MKRELGVTDYEEIYLIAKEEMGLPLQAHETIVVPIPLDGTHMPDVGDSPKRVRLRGIFDLENVNALEGTHVVPFAPEGVTLFYGNNASGKSGYCRVLRNACRARGEEALILPNIFLPLPLTKARAKFSVELDEEGQSVIEWEDGQDVSTPLGRVAVFDSQVARVHVEKENLVFMPYGTDIFAKFVDALVKVKAQVEVHLEEDLIKIVSSDLILIKSQTTPVGTFLQLIGSLLETYEVSTDKALVDALALLHLSEEEAQEINELENVLKSDPGSEVKRYEKAVKEVDSIRHTFQSLQNWLRGEAFEQMKKGYDSALTLSEAAKLASQEAFSKDPLTGTGGEAWKALFESARDFSSHAYPGEKFPFCDGLCPLCQQKLQQDDGADRLRRFANFLEKDTALKASLAKKASVILINAFKSGLVDFHSDILELSGGLKSFSPWLHGVLKDYLSRLKGLLDQFHLIVKEGRFEACDALIQPLLLEELQCLLDSLAERQNHFMKQSNPKQMQVARTKLMHLKERRVLTLKIEEINMALEQSRVNQKTREGVQTLHTRKVTDFARSILEKTVDKPLRDAFFNELKALHADRISIAMDGKPTLGSFAHRMKVSASSYKQDVSNVLSEGEQRVVAVAAFLAEISLSEETCGIVFDDPVCSLDHHWREEIARRLVQEGLKRQVIIFTHDVFFFEAIQRFSQELKTKGENAKYLCLQVEKQNGIPGRLRKKNLSWQISSAHKRVKELKNHLQSIEAYHRACGEDDEYRKLIERFYSDLRESWERAVEYDLLQGVVQRFKPGIETLKLRYIEVKDEDFQKVHKGMTRCSAFAAHDKAPSSDVTLPSPQELSEDLRDLEDFLTTLKKRQEATSDQREVLISPELSEDDISDLEPFIAQHRSVGQDKAEQSRELGAIVQGKGSSSLPTIKGLFNKVEEPAS